MTLLDASRIDILVGSCSCPPPSSGSSCGSQARPRLGRYSCAISNSVFRQRAARLPLREIRSPRSGSALRGPATPLPRRVRRAQFVRVARSLDLAEPPACMLGSVVVATYGIHRVAHHGSSHAHATTPCAERKGTSRVGEALAHRNRLGSGWSGQRGWKGSGVRRNRSPAPMQADESRLGRHADRAQKPHFAWSFQYPFLALARVRSR